MTVADSTGKNGLNGIAGRPSGDGYTDDRLIRARIDRERREARHQARIADRQAAAQLRREDAITRRTIRDNARQGRAARRAAAVAWCQARTVDLLFIPVIGVPGALSWTGMAAYGVTEFGAPGLALPALSEGGMWAFAAATTITRRQHPDKPVWHLRLGTLLFAAYGAALNFLHGLSKGGVLTGVSMALISVAGVTAHQLITAGPRRSRSEREQARIDRAVARRERAARRAAVRSASVQLDGSGHARLVFEAATATLSRGRLSRMRLEFGGDRALAPDVAPVRVSDPVQAEAVPAPEPVYGHKPVRATCTGGDQAAAARTTRGGPHEQTEVSATHDDLEGDPSRWDPPADRNAAVAELADQIRDAVRAGDIWRPNYSELMAATGRKRSWCEKVVHDARSAVLEVPASTDEDDRTVLRDAADLAPPITNTAKWPSPIRR
jgi:hypothetical protein